MHVSIVPRIILASASPRRRELLSSLGYAFEVIIPQVDETPLQGEMAPDFARRAAMDKAQWVAGTLDAEQPLCVIGADTIVVVDGAICGKPADVAAAADMLRRLSGRQHEVLTGLCLIQKHGAQQTVQTQVVRTAVEFKSLTDAEISAYVATGEPMDKAGAYGIQGQAAYMVRSIQGSYTNVVGFPLTEVSDWLSASQFSATRAN